MTEPRVRLVGRADDAGSCHTANRAVAEVLDAGLALNASVMVPCPAFDEAARLFAGRRGICVGLHATITAEWDTLKWGPVLPPGRVPSLVDSQGHFPPHTRALHEQGADPDEVLAELEAQLARARAAGLHIAYLDTHMGFGWLPGVEERLNGLCGREGLVRCRGLSPLPRVEGDFADPADLLIARLEAAEPGTYLFVVHPGRDTDEMRRLTHEGLAPGQVARQREADTRMLTSGKVVAWCEAHGVEPILLPDGLA